MNNGKIIWDTSNTLELHNIVDYHRTFEEDRKDNFSVSKKHEAISFGEQQTVRLRLQKVTLEQAYKMLAWWSWARRGQEFSFELLPGAGSPGDTTLDGSAASGQKIVPLTSTSDFSVGEHCLLKEIAGDDYEAVKIASISAGVSITAEEDLIYSYTTSDIFRKLNYFPNLVMKPTKFDLPLPGPGDYYDLDLEFQEMTP